MKYEASVVARKMRAPLAEEVVTQLAALLSLFSRYGEAPPALSAQGMVSDDYLRKTVTDDPSFRWCLFGWLFVHTLGKVAGRRGLRGAEPKLDRRVAVWKNSCRSHAGSWCGGV